MSTLAYPKSGYAWFVVGVLVLASLVSFVDRQVIALLVTPMNVATVAGFAVAATELPRPEIVMTTLKLAGDAMIPLMLFALGVRMVTVGASGWRAGLLGAVVCPLSGIAVALLFIAVAAVVYLLVATALVALATRRAFGDDRGPARAQEMGT